MFRNLFSRKPTASYIIEYLIYGTILITPFFLGSIHVPPFTFVEPVTGFLFFILVLKKILNGKIELEVDILNFLILFFLILVFIQFIFFKGVFQNTLKLGTMDRYQTGCGAIRLISYIFLFWIIQGFINTKHKLYKLMNSAIFACAIISALGLYQRLISPEASTFFTFHNYIHFAGYAGMVLPIAVAIFIYEFYNISEYKKMTRGIGKNFASGIYDIKSEVFFLASSIVIIGTALLMLPSRAGVIMFFVSFILFGFLVSNFKEKKFIFLFLITGMIIISILVSWIGVEHIVYRFQYIKERIFDALEVFKAILNLIRDYPIFGTGLNTFEYAFSPYNPKATIAARVTYAHNDFLQLLSETGIAGFTIFLIGALAFLRRMLRLVVHTKDPFIKYLGAGCLAGIVAISGHSMANFNLHIRANIIFLVAIIGTLKVLSTLSKSYPKAKIVSIQISPFLRKPLIFLALMPFLIISFISVREEVAYNMIEYGPNDSIENLTKATRLSPLNANYYYDLSSAYIKRSYEDREKKLELLNRAYIIGKKVFEVSPLYYRGAYNLARICKLLEKEDEAEEYMKMYIKLDPSYYWPHLYYSIHCFNEAAKYKGKEEEKIYIREGIKSYKRAVSIYPTLRLSDYREYLRDYGGVEKILSKAVK